MGGTHNSSVISHSDTVNDSVAIIMMTARNLVQEITNSLLDEYDFFYYWLLPVFTAVFFFRDIYGIWPIWLA